MSANPNIMKESRSANIDKKIMSSTEIIIKMAWLAVEFVFFAIILGKQISRLAIALFVLSAILVAQTTRIAREFTVLFLMLLTQLISKALAGFGKRAEVVKKTEGHRPFSAAAPAETALGFRNVEATTASVAAPRLPDAPETAEEEGTRNVEATIASVAAPPLPDAPETAEAIAEEPLRPIRASEYNKEVYADACERFAKAALANKNWQARRRRTEADITCDGHPLGLAVTWSYSTWHSSAWPSYEVTVSERHARLLDKIDAGVVGSFCRGFGVSRGQLCLYRGAKLLVQAPEPNLTKARRCIEAALKIIQ